MTPCDKNLKKHRTLNSRNPDIHLKVRAKSISILITLHLTTAQIKKIRGTHILLLNYSPIYFEP